MIASGTVQCGSCATLRAQLADSSADLSEALLESGEWQRRAEGLTSQLAGLREALIATCPYCAGRWSHFETEPRLVHTTWVHRIVIYGKPVDDSWAPCALSSGARAALASEGTA